VTGVDNAGKLDFMRSLGADEVIDYRSEDFTRSGSYDFIVNLVAHRSVFAYRRAPAPVAGICVLADRYRRWYAY
jgi:NADPH:quinone reductase-like Zn-dependent oxidoreductase